MRFASKTLTGLTILVFAVGLSACGARESKTKKAASLTLQTYTVPNGHARELSKTLNNVLGTGNDKNQIGRTWFSGTGKIVVLAPKRMQDSIAASIKEIAGTSATTAKPTGPIRLNAWIVDAYPGSGRSDPSLQSIEPALESFSKAMGPAHFTQAHYLTAVSDIGTHTVITPLPGRMFSYGINRSDGGLVLRFNYLNNYRQRSVGLQGQVTVQLGQILVLGLISDRPSETSTGDQATGKNAVAMETDDAQSAETIHRLLVVRITPADQG